MKQLISHLLALLFPQEKRSTCIQRLTANDIRSLVEREHPDRKERAIKGVLSYQHPVAQDLIWALKYEKSRHAATLCGELLYEELLEDISEIVTLSALPLLLIPVPLSYEREQERGYNQSRWIAECLAAKLGEQKGVLADTVLSRIRNTAIQTRLSREDRLRNVRGAFKVVELGAIRNRDCLLIDDVVTTGSTLQEARDTLVKAGARSVSCIAVAYAGK